MTHTPAWPSTPTPTTRPCSRRGRWRVRPRRATGWSSSWPPTATSGWPRTRMPRDGRLGARRLEELRRSASALGRRPRRLPRLRRQRAGPRAAPRPAGPGALRARAPRGGRQPAGRRPARGGRRRCCSPTTATAATGTATTSACTRSASGRHTSRARRACCRRRSRATPSPAPWTSRRKRLPLPAGVRPRRRSRRAFSARVRDHAPHRRAAVCRREAGFDARPRLPVECGGRGGPHAGGVPADPAAALRPGVRPRVVHRPGAARRACPCRTTSSRGCREHRAVGADGDRDAPQTRTAVPGAHGRAGRRRPRAGRRPARLRPAPRWPRPTGPTCGRC